MKKLEGLYQELEKYSDFSKSGNAEKFLETVDKVIILKNSTSIEKLMKYFDDDSEYGWVLESLKVGLDNYPDQIHAKAVIKEIPCMMERAPKWLLSLIYRIFNNPSSLMQFRNNMDLIPKKSMLEFLNLVAKESEYHRDLCNELKKELVSDYKE
ncbi:MAG: hypothetical protein K2X02_08755 [Alphaproteobacteria bacterium]|nr:hypothetical protein [Alphaproteobacteria bacterium]